MVKTLVLDCSTWRCGSNGKNKLGKGVTALLNNQGYMCCLGQFAEQLGVDESLLLNEGQPDDIEVNRVIELITVKNKLGGIKDNSMFTERATKINDNALTTPQQKIKQLTRLLKKYRRELKVINYEFTNTHKGI